MSNDFYLKVIDLLDATAEGDWHAIAKRNPALKFPWIRQMAKRNITEPGCGKLIALYLELTDEPFVIQRETVEC